MTISQQTIRLLLSNIADCYEQNKEHLSQYDAVIGDGDHGYSIARGCAAGIGAVKDLPQNASMPECLKQFGRELTDEIGGAMGPLFGMIFTELAKTAPRTGEMNLSQFSSGMQNAYAKITGLGGAKPGDKTMVDAMKPAIDSLLAGAASGLSLQQALPPACAAAEKGAKDTIPLESRRGRSKYLREKSIGHQDAGATSFYLLMQTFSEFCREG